MHSDLFRLISYGSCSSWTIFDVDNLGQYPVIWGRWNSPLQRRNINMQMRWKYSDFSFILQWNSVNIRKIRLEGVCVLWKEVEIYARSCWSWRTPQILCAGMLLLQFCEMWNWVWLKKKNHLLWWKYIVFKFHLVSYQSWSDIFLQTFANWSLVCSISCWIDWLTGS